MAARTTHQPWFEVALGADLEPAIERVTDALAAEGFGVLTRIDLDAAFESKLGVSFRPYAILGACNPVLAHEAVGQRPEIGLFLPCNVTVEQVSPGRSVVRIVDPVRVLGAAEPGDEALDPIAEEARERLERVARTLQSDT